MKTFLPLITAGLLTAGLSTASLANPLESSIDQEVESLRLLELTFLNECDDAGIFLGDTGVGTCNGDDPECEGIEDPDDECM